MRTRLALPALLVLVTACAAGAARPDFAIDATRRTKVIAGALAAIEKEYVFPEVAKRMVEAIRARSAKGEYDTITSAQALCKALTRDLHAVNRDLHLRVFSSAKPFPKMSDDSGEPTPTMLKRIRERMRRRNFGFSRVERLPGNVGLLKLRFFASPSMAGQLAVAAMALLADTDALIVDIRRNGGGSPEMVALLSSYLFPAKRVHLNSFHIRKGNRTEQFWTSEWVPGRRYGNKPVYVLTSRKTFSGAEEFAYNLRSRKRATLVGQPTGGGAHPVRFRNIDANFAVSVPYGRAVNPITKTNWEGTGVKPHVEVPAPEALRVAHRMALEALVAKEKNPRYRRRLERALGKLRGKPAGKRPRG